MNYHFDEDWEARVASEEAVEAADNWVSRQGARVHAAAGQAGPWGQLHPVAWAYCTNRILAADVPAWRARFDADPTGVSSQMAQMVSAPFLGPQGPQHIRAAAGVSTAPNPFAHLPLAEPPAPEPRRHRNAADELRNTHPGLVDALVRDAGPPPSLFAEGDLPRTTASGLDPAALRGLPWRARLAAAWEPDRLKAFEITQSFAGPDAEDLALVEFAGHPAVSRHVSQVSTWATTTPPAPELTEQEMDAMLPPSHDGPPPADAGSPAA